MCIHEVRNYSQSAKLRSARVTISNTIIAHAYCFILFRARTKNLERFDRSVASSSEIASSILRRPWKDPTGRVPYQDCLGWACPQFIAGLRLSLSWSGFFEPFIGLLLLSTLHSRNCIAFISCPCIMHMGYKKEERHRLFYFSFLGKQFLQLLV